MKKNVTRLLAVIFIIVPTYLYFIITQEEQIDFPEHQIQKNFAIFRNGNRSFSLKYMQILEQLDLIKPIHCVKKERIFKENVVFVSAWSTNHHKEAYSLARTLEQYDGLKDGQKKLIVYNLGLNDSEIQDYLLTFGFMVEFRNFDFSLYPDYVRNLKEYRFKPLIIAQALLEFPAIWWVDSSMTLNNDRRPSLNDLYDSVKKNSNHLFFGITSVATHSIFAATHPKMYEYLPIDVRWAKKLSMSDASHMLWYGTKQTKTDLLKWWVWCALEADCMAPRGSNLTCNFKKSRYTKYANCNRFDQSAISIIATVATDYRVQNYRLNKDVSPLRIIRTVP